MRASHALLGVAAATLAGCAIMAVGSEFRPGADFASYRTYDWDVGAPAGAGDARLDDDSFFDARVREAVEIELGRKGLVSSTDEPHLLLHYHFSVEHQVDIYDVDAELGYQSSERQASEWDEGTLVIGIADAGKRIVWRGWAKVDVTGVLDNRERLAARLQEAVGKIFERYPPR